MMHMDHVTDKAAQMAQILPLAAVEFLQCDSCNLKKWRTTSAVCVEKKKRQQRHATALTQIYSSKADTN